MLSPNIIIAKGNQHDVSVNLVVEFPVSPEVGDRFIDIVVTISEGAGKDIIAIENKIRSSSVKKAQLIEQYEGLKRVSSQ
ncbi:MAG: hypothetical protein Q9N62_01615 [Ghiorsea sp.]|nr:hypothetical protein [Ghiorsea sp.]